MTTQKILGFIFLFAGVGIILFGLYSGFQNFSGKTMPPQIFTAVYQKSSVKQAGVGIDQIQNLVQDQLKNLIPSDMLPKILNLSAWSIFLGLLMVGGGQIAGIGVKLVKQ